MRFSVDIIDLILIIWKKKLSIILIITISLILMYIYVIKIPNPKKIVEVEIRPISVYEESKYKIYNSFVKSLQSRSMEKVSVLITNKDKDDSSQKSDELNKKIDELLEINDISSNSSSLIFQSVVNDLMINNINKKFLFDLFIDQLNQRTNLAKNVSEFNYLDRDKFNNEVEYNQAISEMASDINLIKINKNKKSDNDDFPKYKVQLKIHDLEKLNDFLNFIERKTNEEIQKNLNLMFESYIKFVDDISNYQIEDLDNQLVLANSLEKQIIEKKKSFLKSDLYVNRMKEIYFDSPVSNKEIFYAAKIVKDSIAINSQNKQIFKFMILAVIIGLVIGIIYAMVSSAIAKRSK